MTKSVNKRPFLLSADGWQFWAVFVALGMAFLQPLHVQEFPTFIEDFGLGLAVILLCFIGVFSRGKLFLSELFWAWLLFGSLLIFALAFSSLSFLSQLNLYAGAWLVGLASTQLVWGKGTSDSFAKAVLVISLLSAFLGLVRLYGLGGIFSFYIPEPPSGRMVGVLGQSNLFAFICFLGGLSSAWLLGRRLLGWWGVVGVFSVLSYCMVLAGTRVVYVCFMVCLLAVFWGGRRVAEGRFFLGVVCFVVVYVLFKFIALEINYVVAEFLKSHGFMPWAGVHSGSVEGRGMGSAARLTEWRVALEVIASSMPWGVGPGAYAAASYNAHLAMGLVPVSGGIFTHSHNSYLQIIAEFGVAGLAWLALAGVVVLRVIRRLFLSGDFLILCVVLSLLVYSFFEFPLWNMQYFVLFFFVLLKGQDVKVVYVKRMWGGVGASLVAMVFCYYVEVVPGMVRSHMSKFNQEILADYSYINFWVRDPLLEHYGYVVYLASDNFSSARLQHDLQLMRRFEKFLPFPAIMSRYSISLAAVGEHESSIEVAEKVLRYAPENIELFRMKIESVERSVPEWDLSILKDFLRKYEFEPQ